MKTHLITSLIALLPLVLPAQAGAQLYRGPFDANRAAPPMRGALSRSLPPGLRVAARDAQRGAPTLIVGGADPTNAGGAPVATHASSAATAHLRRLAPLYGLSPRALGSAEVALVRPTAGGSLVVIQQRVDGALLFETRLSMLLDGQGRLRAAGGQLHPVAAGRYAFRVDIAHAVTSALADAWGRLAPRDSLVAPSPILTRGQSDLYFDLTGAARAEGYSLDDPARARRVFYPMPTRLVPAIYVELWIDDAQRGPVLVAYVVSAEDGGILHRRLLTDDEVFDYTVYADETAPYLPADSPFGDTTPTVDARPVETLPSFVTPSVVAMEGFNTNPSGASDPWLPPSATETRGNNADAYADSVEPNGFSDGDLRAATTASGVFGHVYDPMREPNADDAQRSAVVTQLFYVNNWLHDYFYDRGFDEASGNAQQDNYGRGGEEGDRLRLEAMDYAGTNNANMSTPSDGSSPRMQMFRWSGWRRVGIEVAGATLGVGIARWGPSVFDLTAPTTIVDDGVDTVTDGCEPSAYDLSGQIALVDRGNCTFGQKALNAQAAGALGVIVMNDRAGGTTTMAGTPAGPVTIPALFVTQTNGAFLRAAALGMPTRMRRTEVSPRPESSLDATVVVHEWAHYLHRRLVFGNSRQRSAQGEGWGDLMALVMLARSTDDFDGAHPHAGYSNHGRAPVYFGTRRVPYSSNRALNDLSFRHISDGVPLPTEHPLDPSSSDNSEVHNAGEVWATMGFDAFAQLVARSREPSAPYDFEEARARFAEYVVLGMQLAPTAPTFTEQRDAILAAALDRDVEDARRIAMAFAARGAGTCARAPSRGSTDLLGVVEDLSVAPVGVLEELDLELVGPGRRCDADGLLDAGEAGTVRVRVHNTGAVAFRDVAVVLEATDPALNVVGSATWPVTDLAPGDGEDILIPVELAETDDIPTFVTLRAVLSGGDLCEEVMRERRFPMNRDEASSTVESFERPPAWFSESSLDDASSGVWSVRPSLLGFDSGVLHAVDTASLTDTAVELPEIIGSSSESVVLSFEHRFSFEADDTTLWDGGVIEYSVDGGATWSDVDALADPGYSGVLSDRADSPLSLRPAYSGDNPSAPAADSVSLDFGAAFADVAVRFRFRVGTDRATGGVGWEIDGLSLTGGSPVPFTALVADEADCADAPVADAGADLEVDAGDVVMLDARGSFDPNGDPLDFSWEVVAGGSSLVLANADTATPEFTAPLVGELTTLVLRLTVSDGAASASDDVQVAVVPMEAPEDAGAVSQDADAMGDGGDAFGDDAWSGAPVGTLSGGGCSCRVGPPTRPGPPLASLLLGCLLFIGVGRRRRRGRRGVHDPS